MLSIRVQLIIKCILQEALLVLLHLLLVTTVVNYIPRAYTIDSLVYCKLLEYFWEVEGDRAVADHLLEGSKHDHDV